MLKLSKSRENAWYTFSLTKICHFTCLAFQNTSCSSLHFPCAHCGCGCPIGGSVQGQVGRGLEQPVLVEGVPACGRGLDLDEL